MKFLIKAGMIFTVLLLISIFSYSNTKNRAEANVEFGIDSNERKYYKPQINFCFPINSVKLFVGAKYYQRSNSKLIGEIDYWLKGGLFFRIKDNFEIETGLYHMCRHLTSHENLEIFDLNEIISRLWANLNNTTVGLGIGTYIGNNKYRNLLILNTKFNKIFNSELSFNSEFKIVNLEKFLHEIEFSIALDKGFDFFLRNTTTYDYRNMTYIGFRIKSDGYIKNYINKLKLGTKFYPFDENYKLGVENEFKIEFFKSKFKRLVVQVQSFTPILKGEKFLGTFWPERMTYPLLIKYERKIKDFYLFGYCDYKIDIPLDVNKRFTSSLGTGLGIKNQKDFEYLENKFRYELSSGYNFKNNFDLVLNLGVNTLKKKINTGVDMNLTLNAKKTFFGFKIFSSFNKEIEVRPFLKYEVLNHTEESEKRFSIGIEFIKWY